MLSICIPVYNFDMRLSLKLLGEQIQRLNEAVELIVIDDASALGFREINKVAAQNFQYIGLEKNVGRASIRNLFLKYTTYDYLLFLDCDSLIIDEHFIAKYLEIIKTAQPPVVCGGRVYGETPPGKEKYLRWKYGTKRESQSVGQRMKEPNNSFMTNNFLIQKSVLQEVQFDERLKDYGHEDTLFGYELLKKSIHITHINNPVGNGDIEDNAVFLEKTEYGVKNLKVIIKNMSDDQQLIKMVRLLRIREMVKRYRLTAFIRLLFSVTRKPIKNSLINGPFNLFLFDFYKLGLLISKDS